MPSVSYRFGVPFERAGPPLELVLAPALDVPVPVRRAALAGRAVVDPDFEADLEADLEPDFDAGRRLLGIGSRA